MSVPYDIALGVLVIDSRTATERSQGSDWLTIASRPLTAASDSIGGQALTSVVHQYHREGTIVCGFGSAWHAILGDLLASQQRQRNAGAFDGFIASFRYSGHVAITGRLLIAEEPEIKQGSAVSAWSWPVLWLDPFVVYGPNA